MKNPEPPAYEKAVSPSHSKRKSLLKEPSKSEADFELFKEPNQMVITISIEKPVTTLDWI